MSVIPLAPTSLVFSARTANSSQEVPILKRLVAALSAPPPVVEGIDLNKYQKGEFVDPQAAYDSGIRFIIAEACWGLDERPTFYEFWRKAVDINLPVIPYGFFRGDQDGVAQAEYLLELSQPMWEAQGFVTPAFADVEPFVGDTSTPAIRIPRFVAWTNTIRKVTRPGAYSNIPSWQALMNNFVLADDVIGWAAHYTPYWESFLVPVGWKRENVKFLQYGIARVHSWCPAVPGLTGDVSRDKFFGTEEELKSLFVEIVPEPPPGGNMELIKAIEDAIVLNAQLTTQLEEVLRLAELEPTPEPEPPPPPPPPPSGDIKITITKDPRSNAHFAKRYNDVGKPIMEIYPSSSSPTSERIQFKLGTVLKAKTDKVVADGGRKYFQLTQHFGRAGEALYIYDKEAVKS